jgi:Fimbrial assembly protein (PilN)
MFLLILQEQKIKLLRQYRLRLLFVVISFLVILIAYGVFTLIPAYIYIHGEEESILKSYEGLKKSITDKSDGDLEKSLQNIKENIEALKGEDANILLTVKLIVDSRPSNVRLTKLSYSYNPEDISIFEVVGVADDRASLIKFSKNLQANPIFTKVELPISNLAKDSSIDFNITITGKF